MPSNSFPRQALSAIPTVGSRIETPAQKIYRYTKDLALAKSKDSINQAFLRLSQLDCPMKVFEKCKTEQVLARYYDRRVEYLYQVNVLDRKFKKLRSHDIKKIQDEEYNPEYPEYQVTEHQKSRLMEVYAVYTPTPIRK